MTASDVQRIFLERLNLRLGPEMAAYVLGRMESDAPWPALGSIPVIAGDARTGRPFRVSVPLAALAPDPSHPPLNPEP